MNSDDGTITKENVSEKTYGYGYSLHKHDPSHCAATAWDRSTRFTRPIQCSRKPGFGTDNLFCKQHAKAEASEIRKVYSIKSCGGYMSYNLDNYEIEEYSATKITEQSVFLVNQNGEVRREAREGTYKTFFPTKKEAIEALVNRAKSNIKNSKEKISLAEKFLKSVKNNENLL